MFPHEKNFIVLEVTGESTDVAYIKGGILVKVSSLAQGVNEILRQAHAGVVHKETKTKSVDIVQNPEFAKSVEAAQAAWLESIRGLFQEFASEQALPRTIFLVSSDDSRDYLSRLLNDTSFRSLWLSDEPLRVVGIAPSHLSPFIGRGPEMEPDTALALLALYASYKPAS